MTRTLLAIAVLLGTATTYAAEPSATVGQDLPARTYDFTYQIRSDGRPLVIQAFDDGPRTYLQLAKGDLPAIFAVTVAGQALLTPRREGQFVVVERVEKQLLLTLGTTRTTVAYAGTGSRNDPPAAFRGGVQPVAVTGAPPSPVPATVILAKRKDASAIPTPDAPQVPAGAAPAKDPGQKTGTEPAVAPKPAAPAVAPSPAIKPAAPPQGGTASTATPLQIWRVATEDGLISATLARWAKDAGWAFSFEAPRDFETRIPAEFSGTFEEAVTAVVTAYANSDSPIKAVFSRSGANKACRILKYEGNSHE